MPSIKSITQASGYIAAFAAHEKEDDRFEHVICWSVIEFDAEDEPDEVVGQIFDGRCITEASAVDEEEGYGEFVGYFRDGETGWKEAMEACDLYRERESATEDEEDEEEEDEEEDPPKKKKNKKSSEDDDEDDADEGEEDDDFSSWDDDE